MRNPDMEELRVNFRMPDMTGEKNLQGLLVKRPSDRFPEDLEELLEFKESPILTPDEVPDNHIYMRVLYASVDPAMRMWMSGVKTYFKALHIGDVMHCFGVGEVLYSKYPAYEPGDLVYVNTGLQRYSLIDVGKANHIFPIPPKGNFSPHHYLNALGTNGSTAYFGLLKIAKPKKGETCVISTAAGATGLMACQMAKIAGCRVVGLCGSDKKVDYLLNEMGVDAAINYKTGSLLKKLKEACPKGIDIYYDNVGEEMLDTILSLMNVNGRIALAGAMSAYVDFPNRKGISNYGNIVTKRIKMRGFLAFESVNHYPEMSQYFIDNIANGNLKPIEEIYYDLRDAPKALKKLFLGENIGKLLFDLHTKIKPTAKL